MSIFDKLNKINVNDYTEKKNGLTYLTWSRAWGEVKKLYPNATYEIKRFDDGQPYYYDEKTGYMVFTSVTIEELTHEMWLPVMDSANKAMKDKPYTYDTRYKKGLTVEAATMFDINKTIMRCLAKNLAMFGLGLYIYAGEDLPETDDTQEQPKQQDGQINEKQIQKIQSILTVFPKENKDTSLNILLNEFGAKELSALQQDKYVLFINRLTDTANGVVNSRLSNLVKQFMNKSGKTESEVRELLKAGLGKGIDEVTIAEFHKYAHDALQMIKDYGGNTDE